MLEYLSENAQLMNAGLNAAMVLIWVVYLHRFLRSHNRQARSVIHIDLGAAGGARSRCLVTNLSSGAVYVQGIVAELGAKGHTTRTTVTDRDEIDEADVTDPMARTNRGTLQSGETVDIGSLSDLVQRARIRLGEKWTFDEIDSVTVTVVAISSQADRVVGAAKEFRIEDTSRMAEFTAQSILTRQIRPRQTRAEYNGLLRERRFQ